MFLIKHTYLVPQFPSLSKSTTSHIYASSFRWSYISWCISPTEFCHCPYEKTRVEIFSKNNKHAIILNRLIFSPLKLSCNTYFNLIYTSLIACTLLYFYLPPFVGFYLNQCKYIEVYLLFDNTDPFSIFPNWSNSITFMSYKPIDETSTQHNINFDSISEFLSCTSSKTFQYQFQLNHYFNQHIHCQY